MSKILISLIILIFFNFNKIKSSDEKSDNNRINSNENLIKNKINKRKLQQFNPIRIYIDTYYLNNNDLDDPQYREMFNIYNASLLKAKNTLEKLINVTRENEIDNSLYINSLVGKGYSENKLDPEIKNGQKKLYYDLVIFIRTNLISVNCGELAEIIKTNTIGRPIIGILTINSNYYQKIENNNTYKIEFYSTIFLHQFTHILGFKRAFLNTFNSKISFKEGTNTRIDGKQIKKILIYSDALITFARKYFNCESINDIELEEINDYGEECLDYIHWDARILLGEYMTSFAYVQEQVISEFTLIILEDTGLYKINKYTGGLMRFGKNAGCDFFKEDCNNILEIEQQTQNTQKYTKFKNEFCASNTKTTCSSGRLSRGICDNYYSLSLTVYSRLDWGLYGNKYVEFCPISISEKEEDEANKIYSYIGNCKMGKKENFGKLAFHYWLNNFDYSYSIFSSSYGEVFSENSFCAFSSIIDKNDVRKNIYNGFIRPTCYEMYCSESSLTVRINEQYIVCPRGGGYINIGGNYMGHLLCSDYNLICSQTVPCNNMFDCVDKKSQMKLNYIYDYNQTNVSSQIILPDNGTIYDPAYELSDDGKCPKNCSQCYENRKCFVCQKNHIYIGVREDDLNPVICSIKAPGNEDPYYRKNDTHYFHCIEHCLRCNASDKCSQCEPEFRLNKNGVCEERIKGCEIYDNTSSYNDYITNNGYIGYQKCEKCNNSRGYYCFDSNKTFCDTIKDDKNTYFNNSFGCMEKCEKNTPNCYNCTIEGCTNCKQGYYLNYQKKCLKKVDNCLNDTINTEIPQCDKCRDNYRCLNSDKTKCNYISNLDIYYYINDHIDNDCMELCNKRYDIKCINCTKEKCDNCINGFFVYNNNICVESLENCTLHYYNETTKIKYCKICYENNFCINNNKSICSYIPPEEENTYYKFYKYEQNETPCLEKCFKKFNYCLKCNENNCIECAENTGPQDSKGNCLVDPNMEQIGNCLIKLHEINNNIKQIDLSLYPFQYTPNFPNFNVIEHYINKDYTITVFIHSECTEDLLNQGYFKIDSKELQGSIVKEFNVNENLIYSVFVTHNFKSHFRYYDYQLNYLNTTIKSNSAKNIDYIITNKYVKNINKTLGSLVASLVELEKLNIFEKDSKVFNNYCQNITFLNIDMPLKQRLLLLYPDKFSERLACLGEDCVIEEFNFDESTCKCKCKIGNKFEDIFEEDKFTHYDGEIEEFNNFIDSIGIIRCVGNGFSIKNMKANAGFFLVLIGIIAQIVLYIYYSLCSDPIVNFIKGTNNPPKRAIMIFSDWDRRINKRNDAEGEVFIQPRDDADEQLLEEERTYSNEGNESSISIDTNVGGDLKKKGKNKLSEKPDRKVLILLKNKGGKKSKSSKDYEDIKSDSEIIKLNDEENLEEISYCKIYWSVVSLKQHIINYFSFIHCCKITKSYIPLSMRIIRSIFLIFLSFVFNILFLNQIYYEKKFNYFNEKYIFIHSENLDVKVSTGERISYAISNTFGYAMISFILLIIVNFVVGYFFFSVRNNLGEIMKNNDLSEINDLVSKTKKKNIIFFIINIILMIIFFLTITAFVGAYGGGFVDYFIPGIISLIFLELFPFLWSLIIALFTYLGIKGKNKCFLSFGKFFMF